MKFDLGFLQALTDSRRTSRFLALLYSEELHDLYAHIAAIHERNTRNGWTSHGHSLDHDLAVTAFAHAIGYARGYADDCVFVMAAGLMHSYDRYRRSEESEQTFTEVDVREWADKFLSRFNDEGRQAVVEAVLRHDKPNKGKITKNPTVGDILADADKLANLMFYTLIRSGQYEPNKPTVILDSLGKMSEGSNYKFHRSAIDDFYGMLEWVDDYSWFVTDEAKELARILEKPLRFFVEINNRQFAALGLDKLP